MCHGVGAAAVFHDLRVGIAAPCAQKGIAAGVKAVNGRVDGEKGVVVAALAVFGLVVERAALDLDLAGRKVALEVGGVIHGVPQAKLHIAEHSKGFRRAAFIRQHQTVDLAIIADRHKQLKARCQIIFLAGDGGIAQTVAAFVKIQFRLSGLPAGVPDGIALFYIVIATVGVCRYVVVTVTGNAPQLGVLVKAVPARCVGNKAEKCLAAQIVDPRQGGLGRGDDVFSGGVIKVSKLHTDRLLYNGIDRGFYAGGISIGI